MLKLSILFRKDDTEIYIAPLQFFSSVYFVLHGSNSNVEVIVELGTTVDLVWKSNSKDFKILMNSQRWLMNHALKQDDEKIYENPKYENTNIESRKKL